MLCLAPVETCQITPFTLPMPTQTTRSALALILRTVCVLGKSYERTTACFVFFPCWYARVCTVSAVAPPALLLLVLQQKNICLTTVRETENSSAWNHIFKLHRRGPLRRRTRKVLSLWHTHGSCTKKLISALPNYGSTELFGARAEQQGSYRKKEGGRRGSSVFFHWT